MRCWSAVALALAGAGCVFSADYHSGRTTCSDGRCPSGLVCSTGLVCVTPSTDAGSSGSDAGSSGSDADAHVAALTCGDPGVLASGVAVAGTTVGRSDQVSATCDGAIMNGPDAVYAIAIGAPQSLVVELAGSDALASYVLATCAAGTPACTGDTYASAGSGAVTVSPGAAGTYYVVVDSVLAAGSGTYTLTVTAD